MVTDDALEHAEIKPLMCHFWQTIHHMRQVSFQNFVWGCIPKSQEMPSIPPPCFSSLDPAALTPNGRLAKSLTACQPTLGFPSNLPTRRLVMSKHSYAPPCNFHFSPSFITNFSSTYTSSPEELHIFCNDPKMAELGHVAMHQRMLQFTIVFTPTWRQRLR